MNKKEKERVKHLLSKLREEVGEASLPVVDEIRKAFGQMRRELSMTNLRLDEAHQTSKARKDTGQQMATLEQQITAVNNNLHSSKNRERFLQNKLAQLEKEQEQRRRRYPYLPPEKLKEWFEAEYDFFDNKHTIVACKCIACSLHFHVFTWCATNLVEAGLHCPECKSSVVLSMPIPVRGPIYAEWGYGACGWPPKHGLHKEGGMQRDADSASQEQQDKSEDD